MLGKVAGINQGITGASALDDGGKVEQGKGFQG
jgi:hypothetical protein